MIEQTNNKNVALPPLNISEDGRVTCGNCKEVFIKAKRCTFCGQLILYPVFSKEADNIGDNSFESHMVNSGEGIYKFLKEAGNWSLSPNSLDSSQNYIIISPYNISFNWKKKKGQIRVNCKKEEMQWIEEITGLKHVDNTGDAVRPYSFLLNSFKEFNSVIDAIKKI